MVVFSHLSYPQFLVILQKFLSKLTLKYSYKSFCSQVNLNVLEIQATFLGLWSIVSYWESFSYASLLVGRFYMGFLQSASQY